MPIDSDILLKRLTPAVSPIASSRLQQPKPLLDFDALIQLVSSGEPVGDPVGGRTEGLDEDQQRRFTAAADMALARGFDQVVVMIDGRSFMLDVQSRESAGEIRSEGPAKLTEVQAVIHAADPNASRPRPLGPPGGIAPIGIQQSIYQSSGA